MIEADPEDVVVMEGELKTGIHPALSVIHFHFHLNQFICYQDYLLNREFSSYQAGGGKVLYE